MYDGNPGEIDFGSSSRGFELSGVDCTYHLFSLYKNMCDKNMCASFNPSKLKELKILKKMTSKPADAYGHIET